MNVSAVSYRPLATGFRFIEGPVLYPNGDLAFTDIFNDRIYRLFAADGDLELLEPDIRRPNGMTLTPDGELLVCQGGARVLSLRDRRGAFSTLAATYESRRLNSPNDVVFGPNGRIYFTDPPWGIRPEEREQEAAGVYMLAADGGLQQVAGNLSYPNGLAFSADFSRLYVSNSKPPEQRSLWVYEVRADGSLDAGRRLAWMLAEADGVPDGLKLHPDGTIFCTGPGGVWLFHPDGEHLGTLAPPENPANCIFSEDFHTLFLTARTSLYAADLSGLEL